MIFKGQNGDWRFYKMSGSKNPSGWMDDLQFWPFIRWIPKNKRDRHTHIFKINFEKFIKKVIPLLWVSWWTCTKLAEDGSAIRASPLLVSLPEKNLILYCSLMAVILTFFLNLISIQTIKQCHINNPSFETCTMGKRCKDSTLHFDVSNS